MSLINKVFTLEEKGFTWLDIISPNHPELLEVADEYGLHATSLEDCLDPVHQPKFEHIDDVLFVIVRAFDEDCDEKTNIVQQLSRKVAIFIGQDFIITVHRCDMEFISQLRLKWQNKTNLSPTDITLLLPELLKAAVFSYAPALEKLEQSLEEFETGIFSNQDTGEIIQEIHWFRSRVSSIRRIFRQTSDVILKIDDYADENAPLYQDVRERLERYINLTEALRESSNDILNTHISLASHRTNEVMRLLTIISVFFLPLTFIVGIYGMNFPKMPELQLPYGYPIAWLVMLGITLSIYVWFKKKKWM